MGRVRQLRHCVHQIVADDGDGRSGRGTNQVVESLGDGENDRLILFSVRIVECKDGECGRHGSYLKRHRAVTNAERVDNELSARGDIVLVESGISFDREVYDKRVGNRSGACEPKSRVRGPISSDTLERLTGTETRGRVLSNVRSSNGPMRLTSAAGMRRCDSEWRMTPPSSGLPPQSVKILQPRKKHLSAFTSCRTRLAEISLDSQTSSKSRLTLPWH